MGKTKKRSKFTASSAIMLIIFIIMAAITLLPFFSIFLASLRPGQEVIRQGLGFNFDTSVMSMDNYALLFSGETPYFTWFGNSMLITATQTASTLAVSAFVGYGFAMYDFKFKNLLFTCVLIIMMIPMEIIMLPLFRLMIALKLIDTLRGKLNVFGISVNANNVKK